MPLTIVETDLHVRRRRDGLLFIGHFALGFAAKRAAPRLSLAVLFAAAQLADLMWPFLLAGGIEQVRIDPGITAFTPLDFVSYPYSHSLLFLAIWGVLFGLIWGLIIFNIDRFIVSSTGKGDGTDAITWSEFTRSLPRLVMATVIAFAISSPLEIRILQPEINAQLELEQNEYVQRLNETSGRDIAEKQEEVRKAIAKNLEGLANLQKVWDARRVVIDQQQHELDLEAEGRSATGRAGVGPAFRVKVETRDRLQAAWDRDRPVNESEQHRLKETNAQLQIRLQQLATQLDSLRESNLKVARSQDGLLKRVQISHEIGGAVPWLIFAMLFIIETGPIFFKMMIVKGAYDYFEENLKRLELARAGIELDAKVYVTEGNREVRVDVFHQAVRALEEEKERLRTESALSRVVHETFEATTAADIRRDPSKFVVSPEHKALEPQS